MKVKSEATRPESFAGQEDFLLFQQKSRASKPKKQKLIIGIIIGVLAVLIMLSAVCFICPVWLMNILPAKAYYYIAGAKLLRQAAFETPEESFGYSGRVFLEGGINGEYDAYFSKDGGKLITVISDDNAGVLFKIVTDGGNAYICIPAIRDEYASAEYGLSIDSSYIKEQGKKLLLSASDVYYEEALGGKGICAVYNEPADLFSEPLEKELIEYLFPDGICIMKFYNNPKKIVLSNGSQSAALTGFNEEQPKEIEIPKESIDISGGWDGYFEGLREDSAEAFEKLPGVIKTEPKNLWKEQAVPVDLSMTKIAVKREKFGLPWTYENLPDGLPSPKNEQVLPGETLEFMSPDGSIRGIIKNYNDVPVYSEKCDVIALEIMSDSWNMTVNKAGIGTSEGELMKLLGEASWEKTYGNETIYRYWDKDHLIKIDFRVKNQSVTGIRYEITE